MASIDSITPMMSQYIEIKKDNQDVFLGFRMGDFFEFFFEDAKKVSSILGLALTKRGKFKGEDVPMCGVPVHAFDFYVKKLIKEKCKIAVCDQLETPEEAKKRGGYKAIVKRGITRIITAGTLIEDDLLPEETNNFLLSFCVIKNRVGISIIDISTGDFFIDLSSISDLVSKIMSYNPSEILISKDFNDEKVKDFLYKNFNVTEIPSAKYNYLSEKERIEKYFNVVSLDSIGNLFHEEVISAGVILEYISLTKIGNIKIHFPIKIQNSKYMYIDYGTLRNLEIFKTLTGDTKNSFSGVINNTKTKMGSRLLFSRILHPSAEQIIISKRIDSVEFLVNNPDLLNNVIDILKNIPDFERALSRIQLNKCTPMDFGIIRDGIIYSKRLKGLFDNCERYDLTSKLELFESISNMFIDDSLIKLLLDSFAEDGLQNNLKSFGFIKSSYNEDLAKYRNMAENNSSEIEKLQSYYISETGINTLRIKSNNIIGYFVEVPLSQKNKVPEEFLKKQDTVNSVRYKTLELDELQTELVNAKENAEKLELEILYNIRNEILKYSDYIDKIAKSISVIDVNAGFAELAIKNNYIKPIFNESNDFIIKNGRHVVIENLCQNNTYIPNNAELIDRKVVIVTGPNMSGKSTYLRQNALLVILGQIGSFIPAEYAEIGIVDKLFSRIGASDDLISGKSTFMVEMIETAAILNQATSKSFVILDEVGRGTSTFDGFAIASAVINYLYYVNKCRAFFSTHYHEIKSLQNTLKKVKFITMQITEYNDEIIFNHKAIEGISNKSYGIFVAKLAAIPDQVIDLANEILKNLEKTSDNFSHLNINPCSNLKFDNFSNDAKINDDNKIIEELKMIDVNNMTPMQAIQTLENLVKKANHDVNQLVSNKSSTINR